MLRRDLYYCSAAGIANEKVVVVIKTYFLVDPSAIEGSGFWLGNQFEITIFNTGAGGSFSGEFLCSIFPDGGNSDGVGNLQVLTKVLAIGSGEMGLVEPLANGG